MSPTGVTIGWSTFPTSKVITSARNFIGLKTAGNATDASFLSGEMPSVGRPTRPGSEGFDASNDATDAAGHPEKSVVF